MNGTWELEAYHDSATGTVERNSSKQYRTIELTFTDDGKKGSIQGHTLSNSVEGEYKLTGKNGIKVLQCGGTKTGEPNKWGYKFWDVIHQVNTYERTANRLIIYYNKSKGKMTFIKR